jgi:hypothetical protein
MTLNFAGLRFDNDYKPPLEDSVTGPLMRVDCGTAYSLQCRFDSLVEGLGFIWSVWLPAFVTIVLGALLVWWWL